MTVTAQRATIPPMGKLWVLALLPVALVVGCGSSGSASPSHSTSIPAAKTVPTLDQLKTQTHALDVKLGCPAAAVKSGSGYALGGATGDCWVAAPANSDTTQIYYGVTVFPTAALRDTWISNAEGVGGSYVKGKTASGAFWVVQVQEDSALKTARAAIGGQIV